ncbi:PRC-barrel domain-containing protein [Streptomyces sp. DpondAA-F4a]|nr:PRC-barrel domain-containing protein [Streptomyces sp. DpondAA-F4a]
MGAADGFTDSGELDGLTVFDSDGEKVGTVGRVYVDDDTGKPDWITVKTGMFGMKESFVPLAGARRVGSDLHVSHPKDSVNGSPPGGRRRASVRRGGGGAVSPLRPDQEDHRPRR